MYWIIFSDNLAVKGSLKFAKARCAAVGCTFYVLCVTSCAGMEYDV